MLLARYLHLKKPPLLFARRTYAKKIDAAVPTTFRPESLVALRQTPLDFSNLTRRNVLSISLRYFSGRRFPAGSKGFLYYQPGSTQLAGQLRLRICDDASSFDAGRDLLVDDVRPWGIDLINLVRNERYHLLVATIVQDGFVSPQTIASLRTRLADRGVKPWQNILCALSDPFYVKLDQPVHNLKIISQQHVMEHKLTYAFSTMPRAKHHKIPGPPIAPFTGALKARFELSRLPEHASFGPTLVLKILDVHNLRHVRKDITILKQPVAGTYHYRFPLGTTTMWRLCIDELNGAREAFGPLLDMPGIVYAE